MIFRQLFEPLSSTYTYLLGCEETGQALKLLYPKFIDYAVPGNKQCGVCPVTNESLKTRGSVMIQDATSCLPVPNADPDSGYHWSRWRRAGNARAAG